MTWHGAASGPGRLLTAERPWDKSYGEGRLEADGYAQQKRSAPKQLWGERLGWMMFLLLLLLAAKAPFAPYFVQFASRLAFALWTVRVAITHRCILRRPLFVPFLVFFIISGLAALLSYDPLLSWTRVGWFAMGVLILIVPEAVRSQWGLNLLIIVLLASSFISGLRTAWQYTAGIGTKLLYIRRNCPLAGDGLWSGDMVQEINRHRTRTPGQWADALRLTRGDATLKLHIARTYPLQHFDVVIQRSDLDKWLSDPTASLARGTPLRAQGGFYNSIPYAGLLMILTALSCGLLLNAPTLFIRISLGMLTLVLAISLWLTLTRAYIVATLLSFLLLLTLSRNQQLRRVWLLFMIVAISLTLVWTRDKRHLGSWYGEQNQARIMMWKDSPRLIIRHPVLGIGWDSVFSHGKLWKLKAYTTYPTKISHFHSTPLQVLVDSGLVGLAAWIWLLAAWLRLVVENLQLARARDWFSRGLALGFLGSAAGFVLASLVHYTLGDGEVMGTLWLLMGCAVALHQQLSDCPAQADGQ